MDVLTKMLSSLYLFNCLTSEPTSSADDVPGVIKYDRVVMVSKQNYIYDSSLDPIDSNHIAMCASGIFTVEEIAQLDHDVINELKLSHGIDLSNTDRVRVLPNGVRVWPGVALMLPVKFGDIAGQPWVIVSDTKNRSREYQWLQYEFGTIVILLNGNENTPDSIFFRGYVVHAKANADMAIEGNREIFKSSCMQPAIQVNNLVNFLEYPLTYSIIDSNDQEGVGVSSTAEVNGLANKHDANHVNGRLIEGRIVMTWKK